MSSEGSASASGAQRLSERELQGLLDVGRSLVAELDVEAVLRKVLDTARDLTHSRYAALGIIDASGEQLERFLFVGLDEDVRRRIGPLPRGRGVLGELIRNPAPLRLADVSTHPRSYGFPAEHPSMRTFLGVPIAIRGEAFGNLYLTEKEGGVEFSETDEELVLVLAEWAAIAIDNARLYESVEARRRELERAVRGLEATAAVARAVGFETELARVLELIVEHGRAMVDAPGMLVLLDSGSGGLRVAAVAGEIDSALVGREVDGEELAAGHALAEDLAGGGAAVVVPLGFRGRARGVLVAVDSRESHGFDADDEHLLTSFAASAAIAIATAQSVEADRLRSSVRAAEQERKRWARELHDETLQELGAVKLLLETSRTADRHEALSAAAARGVEQLDLTIQGLQSLISELRPAALDELGIEPAVQALVARMAATSGLDVDARIALGGTGGNDVARLEPELTTTVYRLVQEALTNATKHAGAERVQVEIVENGGAVSVSICDDGAGFERTGVEAGYGLLGMEERVDLVGGTLSIESAPGEGTRIRAELPARHVEPPPASRGGAA